MTLLKRFWCWSLGYHQWTEIDCPKAQPHEHWVICTDCGKRRNIMDKIKEI